MNRLTVPERLLAAIDRAEQWLTTLAFVVLVALIFADVVSRQLTGSGLHWARQVGVYANIVVVLFGIGLASSSGSHLRPRFADGWLPASWQPILIRVQHLLMALFCLGFALVAYGVVAGSLSLGERSAALGIVIWPVQAIIPLTFFVAFVRHAIYAFDPRLAPAEHAEADESAPSTAA